jgi:abequosyltransferase
MSRPPFLSICIPTYARPGPLAQLLESIARQWRDDLEVLVAEDPSDARETAAVVEGMRGRIPRLHYTRNPERLMFDRNLLGLLARGEGEYFWLVSDDDVLEPGGVAAVIAGLRAHDPVTGVTVNRNNYDSTLTAQIYGRPFHQRETSVFTSADEMFTGLLDQIGLLSCQILRRDLCQQVIASPEAQSFVGSGYVQLYVMMQMMALAPRWLYLADKCVGWRADNDSFAERGHLGRLRMDVEGYERVAAAIFSRDSATYRHAIAEVARSHVRHHIVRAKLGGATWAYSRDALALCIRHYETFPSFWLKTFPLLLMPRAGVRLSRSAYQRLKQLLGR